MKYSHTAMYYRARSEQKPRSPKPPPAAAAKYAPQPPHWVPPGPTGVGGGELVSRPGEGVLSARSHRNLFTVELSCKSASGQDRANGSVAIAGCAKFRQIREIGKSPVWTNIAFASIFFVAKLSRKKGFCAHIFYDCNIN